MKKKQPSKDSHQDPHIKNRANTKDIKNSISPEKGNIDSSRNNSKVSRDKSQEKSYGLIGDSSIQERSMKASIQHTAYEQICNAIHEFLLKRGYFQTLDYFQKEQITGRANFSINNSIIHYDKELINYFQKGKRESFFQQWEKFVPVNIRYFDENARKLEFYLQIYFIIYTLHPSYRKTNSKNFDQVHLQKFKEYLDSNGSDLAKTSEFLPFYALPYIKSPLEHPTFKHLFTKEWVIELQNKLLEFINTLYNPDGVPVLYDMYQHYIKKLSGLSNDNSIITYQENNSNVYVNQIENNNNDLLSVIEELNQKYNSLQKNYKQVIFLISLLNQLNKIQQTVRISGRLSLKIQFKSANKFSFLFQFYEFIEQLQEGKQINVKVLQQAVQQAAKYEKFLNMNFEDLVTQSQDISIFDVIFIIQRQSSTLEQHDLKPSFGSNLNSPMNLNNQRLNLDYQKILQVFLKPQQDLTLTYSLLQALRWRVTKTKSLQKRRNIISNYAQNDILSCMSQENIGIQSNLLNTYDKLTKELTLRFINSLASDFQGRSYLVTSQNLVKLLINIIKTEKSDSLIRRNALGALQKLSLRRTPQIWMIDCDMIKIIFEILKNEKDTLSEYTYEYSTALLMNLSLRSAGKNYCERSDLKVLNILNDLLEHDNMQVRTFVNGMLYSLLSRKTIREQAHQLGMQDILTYLMDNSDERFTKQIMYILDQLNKEDDDEDDNQSDQNEEDTDVDDMDEDDQQDEEDDMDEEPNIPNQNLAGNDLLRQEFNSDGSRLRVTKKSIQPLDMPFQRPITPALMKNPSMNISHMQHSQISNSGNQISQQFQNNVSMVSQQLNVPEEMQSKPRIVRTPNDNQRPQPPPKIQINKPQNIQIPQNNSEDEVDRGPKIDIDDPEIKENQGVVFQSRPKIPRSPR